MSKQIWQRPRKLVKPKKSAFSPFKSSTTAAPAATTKATLISAQEDEDQPDMLEGWVEKKGGSRVKMGSDWQKRLVLVSRLVSAVIKKKNKRIE